MLPTLRAPSSFTIESVQRCSKVFDSKVLAEIELVMQFVSLFKPRSAPLQDAPLHTMYEPAVLSVQKIVKIFQFSKSHYFWEFEWSSLEWSFEVLRRYSNVFEIVQRCSKIFESGRNCSKMLRLLCRVSGAEEFSEPTWLLLPLLACRSAFNQMGNTKSLSRKWTTFL